MSAGSPGSSRVDVIVVGAGNAALSAAISAAEAGASVLVLEAADEIERGGNSAYTAGAMRIAFSGRDDLADVLDLSQPPYDTAEFGTYSIDDYLIDFDRLTDGRFDTGLAGVVVTESLDIVRWHRRHGVAFEPNEGRQSALVDGRLRFWGGLPVRVAGEGTALVQALVTSALGLGVELRHGARVAELRTDGGRVVGVELDTGEIIAGGAVVLGCGGFEADPKARSERLGSEWADAKVRGTRHNDGAGIEMAVRVGAARKGDYEGCHAIAWDRSAPATGDIDVAHRFSKNSYPWGVSVNRAGERFFDEASDFRNYTYATYGRTVLAQPGQVAWQIFDARSSELLYAEYERSTVDRFDADSIEALAAAIAESDDAFDAGAFLETIRDYNERVDDTTPYDPSVLDGRAAVGATPPRANWAQPIDKAPFRAYAVTCGITFTFGGLDVDIDGRVRTAQATPVAGLFACGELVGGLFYGNYPGGAGLTAGAVIGRRAGRSAAASATA